jgi:hypothetical protein
VVISENRLTPTRDKAASKFPATSNFIAMLRRLLQRYFEALESMHRGSESDRNKNEQINLSLSRADRVHGSFCD